MFMSALADRIERNFFLLNEISFSNASRNVPVLAISSQEAGQ
jgi:hypothetical protein